MNHPVYCLIEILVAFNNQTEYFIIYRISKSYTIADTPFYSINFILSKVCIYGFLMF